MIYSIWTWRKSDLVERKYSKFIKIQLDVLLKQRHFDGWRLLSLFGVRNGSQYFPPVAYHVQPVRNVTSPSTRTNGSACEVVRSRSFARAMCLSFLQIRKDGWCSASDAAPCISPLSKESSTPSSGYVR